MDEQRFTATIEFSEMDNSDIVPYVSDCGNDGDWNECRGAKI